METLLKDVRYAVRLLLQNRGFTIVALLSLALAIGVNTTIFSVIHSVFLKPLPVADIDTAVAVFGMDENNRILNLNTTPISWPNFEDYRSQNDVFSGLAGIVFTGLTLTGKGDPEVINGAMVSANYFDVLGVKPVVGRTFLPDEDQGVGGHPVAVLSHSVWDRLFHSDRGIVGQTITLNNNAFTVVGVTPPNFKGTNTLAAPDIIWVPSSMHRQVLAGTLLEFFVSRRALFVNAVGRLKPGVTIERAEATMKTIASRLSAGYPNDNQGRSIKLYPLAEAALGINQRSQFRMAGGVLVTAVGLVLLIACVNLANLLLTRGSGREREVGIRSALGAGRSRIVRQLLTESIVLSVAGGVAGLVVAFWSRDLLWSYRPPFLAEDAISLSLDSSVLLFTTAISVLTGILFGFIPALKTSDPNLSEMLKASGRGTSPGKRTRLRASLVVAEISLALIALVAAGLFVKSMREAQRIDVGFETAKLFVIGVNPGGQNMEQSRIEQFYANAVAAAKSTPGVENATITSNFPLGGGFLRSVFKEGQEQKPGQRDLLTLTNIVTPEYFDTVKIPQVKGRLFSDFDRTATPPVVVVNEAMAAKFWPGEEAVGKRFTFFGQTELREIVGIVRNATVFQIGEEPQPAIYLPLAQNFTPAGTIQVRTAVDPESAMATVRQKIQALEPSLPLTNVATIGRQLDQALWAPRMGAALLGLFGILALVLAGVGIYGVMAYSVQQRKQEIGIRMALGAGRQEVIRMVLKQGMTLTILGVLLGSAAAAALSRLVSGLLFGVSATDPLVFAGVAAILILVAFTACYIPALRATRVDPLQALRTE
jgi:predicted permease